jgi:hypothetical protein
MYQNRLYELTRDYAVALEASAELYRAAKAKPETEALDFISHGIEIREGLKEAAKHLERWEGRLEGEAEKAVQSGLNGLRAEIEAYDALVALAKMDSLAQRAEFLGKLKYGREKLGRGGLGLAQLIAPSRKEGKLFGQCIFTRKQQYNIRAILETSKDGYATSDGKTSWEEVGVTAILVALDSGSAEITEAKAPK